MGSRIEIPRWIQLIGLPLLLVLAWILAGAVRHAIFLFLVAALIALLLNPFVRGLMRLRTPRGLAVALVYLCFAAIVASAILALATVVVQQTRSASHRVDAYFTETSGRPSRTGAEQDLDRLQRWLDTHRLGGIKVERKGNEFLNDIGARDVEKYSAKALAWAEGAGLAIVELLFSLVLIVVISIYMLLDMGRFAGFVDRRFPPPPGSEPLLRRVELALAGYVKGQMLLSLIIGTSAGLGLYVLGATGAVPRADRYALLFGSWVALMELIPYLGPWLGAVPPTLYALVVHPLAAVWVVLLFLGIHQIEGHVVVPNVMGSALRLHPLLVIFGLLAGGEIYGLPGALVALPLLAAARTTYEFFSERVRLEPWEAGATVVELAEERPPEQPAAPAAP